MQELQVVNILTDLKKALSKNTSAVLSAPPGAGKTTLVPTALLDEPWLEGRKIIMLEPRRLAARAAAYRMASNLGENVGETIGYRTRLDTKTGRKTRIEVITEGILTRMIQRDPSLSEVSAVIFDEFHERSLHADLGLALCLDSRQSLRPDLRIIIMSATIDVKAVSELLGNAPVLVSGGHFWPVGTKYFPPPAIINNSHPEHSLERHLASVIRKAAMEEKGDILVFLPGSPEIRRVERIIRNTGLSGEMIITPLYSMLSKEEQDIAIMPAQAGRRKIVLATSIAETSLTIGGIGIVIDSGYSRVPRFDAGSGMARLETVRVSKASADQRRGRAGRTGPGVCFRLWDQKSENLLKPENDPEILSSDLAPLALELLQWGVKSPSKLKWLNPPNEQRFTKAVELLRELDAVDGKGRITVTGEKMCSLGIHPRLAHMIIRGKSIGLGGLACETAAVLSEMDFIMNRSRSRNTDMRMRLDALHSEKDTDEEYIPNASALKRIRKTAAVLKDQMKVESDPAVNDTDMTGLLLAFAYPDRIAMRRQGKKAEYLLSGGKGAWLDDSDPLANEEFIAVASLDGDKKNSAVFLAAPIKKQEIVNHFAPHIEIVSLHEWNDDLMGAISTVKESLGRITLSERRQDCTDDAAVERVMVKGIRKMGLDILPWGKESRQFRARLGFILRTGTGVEEWPDVSDVSLLEALDRWLMPHIKGVTRTTQISEDTLFTALESMLTWQKRKRLDELAPSHIRVPSGSRIKLDYKSSDIPVLYVRIQEMFGCRSHPVVAGNIPVIINLLSPAGRPVQVTTDIVGFWTGTYSDVRKEMKGRYPKHAWPEDPMAAPPTTRAKDRAKG